MMPPRSTCAGRRCPRSRTRSDSRPCAPARRGSRREAAGDPDLRRRLRGELERAAASSRWNARANALLAELDMIEDRAPEARRRLEAALAVDPGLPGAHQRLGVVALWEGSPERAIAEFERERRVNPEAPGLDLGLGMAWQRAGDVARARLHYQRELERDPGNVAARAALDSLAQTPR
jgi:tetratricopeptide (TPR) repeat protein